MPVPPDWVGAIAAGASALAAVAGAVAAWRSAEAAKSAASQAETTARRAAHREIAQVAAEIILLDQRAGDLLADLKAAYRDLFMQAGQPGSSQEQKKVSEAVERRCSTEPLAAHARNFSPGLNKLNAAPIEELDRILVTLAANKDAAGAIVTWLLAKLAETREDRSRLERA